MATCYSFGRDFRESRPETIADRETWRSRCELQEKPVREEGQEDFYQRIMRGSSL